jgi:DNA-binding beta-propeller fold protein YncE
LVVLDAAKDSVIKELPLLYKGPSCRDSLSGTDAATAEPAHLLISADKRKLYVQLAGGWLVGDARVREQLVVDISDPADPAQSPSLPIGTSTGYHGEVLSGDGRFLFEADNVDGTVTQIDAEAGQVVKTISVKSNPKTLATWGKAEGPGRQTGPFE